MRKSSAVILRVNTLVGYLLLNLMIVDVEYVNKE